MSEIAKLEQQIKELATQHMMRVKPLQDRLETLKRIEAAEAAPDIVHGQKRRVTSAAKHAWGCGDLNEVITVDYVCYALDRADIEYLAAVVCRGGFGQSTFPVGALRAMPIVE